MKPLILLSALLLVVDWYQTYRISQEPDRFYEAWNVMLPRNPKAWQVHTYFIACLCVFAGLCWFLSGVLLYSVLILCALMEGVCVVDNYRIGIR